MNKHPAKQGYLLCTEHRSGSTLLCELLQSTGQLGNPDEYLKDHKFCFDLERDPALFRSVLESATTDNGIYGIKVFGQQFDVSAKARWIDQLPNLHFIHLVRGDILGQAISFVKALQTDQYWSRTDLPVQPQYDRRAIARQLSRAAENQARWRCYFARNGIRPLLLTYEDIVSDPQDAINDVAAHIGLAERFEIRAEACDLKIQRDETSEMWRERFLREAGDIHYLDHSLGPMRIWLRRRARDVWYFKQKLRS